MTLLALPDERYVVTDGSAAIQGHIVAFATDENANPVMTIDGYDPARWLTFAPDVGKRRRVAPSR